MVQTQLVRLLATLSPAEWQHFDKFLNSSFFNVHKETLALFEVLSAAYPEFDENILEKEKVFEAIYPGKTFKDEQLRTLRKYLLQRLNHFMAYWEWKRDPLAVQLNLLHGLEYRGESKLLEKQFVKGRQLADQEELSSLESYFQRYQLEMYYLNFQATHTKRKSIPEAKLVHQFLDWFYLGTKLLLLASSLNNCLIVRHKREVYPMEEEAYAYVKEQLGNMPPILEAYFWACSLLKLEDEGHALQQLKELLQAHGKSFPKGDLINLYGYQITYSNQAYMSGREGFLEEMFGTYKEMLDQELLFEGDIFPVNNYKNLATLGLRCKQLEWTATFIETYKNYVPLPYRDDVYNYNLAHLFIYQKKYTEALKLLQTLKFLDPFYQLGAKLLQLKIYFEQADVAAFFSFAKTFQTHIRRQKEVPESRKLAYNNFVKQSRLLFRVKIGEKQLGDGLKEELEEMIPVMEVNWLRAKLAELT